MKLRKKSKYNVYQAFFSVGCSPKIGKRSLKICDCPRQRPCFGFQLKSMKNLNNFFLPKHWAPPRRRNVCLHLILLVSLLHFRIFANATLRCYFELVHRAPRVKRTRPTVIAVDRLGRATSKWFD